MSIVLSVFAGLVIIATLLGATALALYVLWWLAMIPVSYLPILGKKHRHADWERLNR